jgi:hypothetical protein
MTLRWQEIVVIPEVEEELPCDCCRLPARRAEGRLAWREAPLGRYSVRWRPGEPSHGARYVLYLGDWTGRLAQDPPRVAAADLVAGPAGGFVLRDDAPRLLRSLGRWRPRFIRRADAIGKPLGERLFAMLDAIHVKDPRLSEMRGWTG